MASCSRDNSTIAGFPPLACLLQRANFIINKYLFENKL
jgi:hypothetical protein